METKGEEDEGEEYRTDDEEIKDQVQLAPVDQDLNAMFEVPKIVQYCNTFGWIRIPSVAPEFGSIEEVPKNGGATTKSSPNEI